MKDKTKNGSSGIHKVNATSLSMVGTPFPPREMSCSGQANSVPYSSSSSLSEKESMNLTKRISSHPVY
jgi:hypothetical protein